MTWNLPKEFPAPSFKIFIALQALDVLTTMLGLRLGAAEASVFVDRLMHLGPLEGLLISKVLALILGLAALRFKRPRVIVFLNYWFAGLVTWNLYTILSTILRRGV